jgi:exopolysaccharide biosynthesis polyprenyl glycosylphosphotransferase
MEQLKNKYLVTMYVFIGMVIYFANIISIDKRLGLKEIFLGIIIFTVYYIADIFDLDDSRYKIKTLFVSCIVNMGMMIILSAFMGIFKSFLLFLVQFTYQNIIKILIYDFLIKEKNILVLGYNYKTDIILKAVENRKKFNITGILTNTGEKKDGHNIIGKYSELVEIVEKYKVDKIVVAIEGVIEQELLKTMLQIKLSGIRVYTFLDFYEKMEERVPVQTINEQWFLFGRGFDIIHNSFNIRAKRIADIIFALTIFLFSFPIMLIAALIIRIESKGPVLFIQERIGKGNEVFKIMKFRSMKIHDESCYSKYADKKDSRITRFGCFMRKTRIDELPQLINVIKGEMSFVGPRPEWNKLCYDYMEQIPFYNLRHSVQPGLTGWAQVNYPYGASVEDAVEKLQYDLYYIKHYSLMLDIIIFFKTIKTVVFGRGR